MASGCDEKRDADKLFAEGKVRSGTAGPEAREKQVVAQSERLSKSVDELKEIASVLGSSLSEISSSSTTSETDKEATTPQEALCTHADFLRSKVYEIRKVVCDLNNLINRLEI